MSAQVSMSGRNSAKPVALRLDQHKDRVSRYFWLQESVLQTHIALAVTCRYQGDGHVRPEDVSQLPLSVRRDGQPARPGSVRRKDL